LLSKGGKGAGREVHSKLKAKKKGGSTHRKSSHWIDFFREGYCFGGTFSSANSSGTWGEKGDPQAYDIASRGSPPINRSSILFEPVYAPCPSTTRRLASTKDFHYQGEGMSGSLDRKIGKEEKRKRIATAEKNSESELAGRVLPKERNSASWKAPNVFPERESCKGK